MTPDERQLISGLFERMRAFGAPEKDGEAEALIRQSVREIPDAPYMLVQSVLVQEHALQQADQRIRELEARTAELETRAARAPAQPGGFLGGLFGGGVTSEGPARPKSRGSVPSAGTRHPSGASAGSGPIGAPRRPVGAQAQAAPGAGGSFLQSAMATAAGVAGGMLLAGSISSMLGGGSSAEAAKGSDSSSQQPPQDQAQDAAHTSGDEGDPDLQDSGYETEAGDWGLDDLDI
ncbi:MAG: DUF2076 family protein [Hyphomicrobiaceae bacterium]|nr:DUF2076 family protein [Hyphomicrobiaceae bacterium]